MFLFQVVAGLVEKVLELSVIFEVLVMWFSDNYIGRIPNVTSQTGYEIEINRLAKR